MEGIQSPYAWEKNIPGAESAEAAALQKFWNKLQKSGGLFQICSLPGGSRCRWAIAWAELQQASKLSEHSSSEYGFWVSDEGHLYPGAWPANTFRIERMICAHPSSAEEAWRYALEAVQTDLFRWVFIRPSRPCAPSFARKFQLEAEHWECRVFILSQQKLPHWVLKATLEVNNEADLIFANSTDTEWFQRSLFGDQSRNLFLSGYS